MLAAFAAVATGAAPASGAVPPGGSHFYGFEGPQRNVDDFLPTSGVLRVSSGGRRFRSSYVKVLFEGGCQARDFRVRLGRRIRIRRSGRFSLRDRRGARRFRVVGRFVSPRYARIAYRARAPRRGRGRRRSCRTSGRVALYRNGEPPYSGCRTQRAKTVLRTAGARVFRQFRRVPRSDGFFPHVYACVIDNGRRFALGRDYDDERIESLRLSDPFVAYARVECGGVGCVSHRIEVLDLRDGTRRTLTQLHSPPGGFPTTIPDLELRDTGSVAWIVRTYREPRNPGSEVREVWASDRQGQRMLDSGTGIDPGSLTLSGPVLSWRKDGAPRSAAID